MNGGNLSRIEKINLFVPLPAGSSSIEDKQESNVMYTTQPLFADLHPPSHLPSTVQVHEQPR